MENSHIEWTDHTFNPWWGCMKVSEGCKNCYAEKLDHRWNGGHWGPGSDRKEQSEKVWQEPHKWNAAALKAGINARVFCASMADVFEDHPDLEKWRERLFMMIADTPNLTWQLLTKRPENIKRFVPGHWLTQDWPDNVWIGTSVESEKMAIVRIPILISVPAKIRFLSCEPLLSEIDFYRVSAAWPAVNHPWRNAPILSDIHWVICGGESGHDARPMHPGWARMLRNQCEEAGVKFFFKQWGEWQDIDHAQAMGIENITNSQLKSSVEIWRDGPRSKSLFKFGKKATGSLLDGVEHKEFPA